tara:strand:- start:173 stop:325 length:153 start_codon:yes stop_codon:yes gene_type:complete
MNKKVEFTSMDHASREDYDLVFKHDLANIDQQFDRVFGWLKMMDGDSPSK